MTTFTQDFRTVGLCGFGVLGTEIARLFAATGRNVVLVEDDNAEVESGIAAAASDAASADPGQGAEAPGRVTVVRCVVDVRGIDAVVVAGAEDVELVKARLVEIAGAVGPDTPILTSTSPLSVTELASAVPNPERVAGLHFLRSLPGDRTIEIVRGMQTPDALIGRLVDVVESLEDKIAIVVDDKPGYLITALLVPYLNDVIQEFDDGLATAEDIDVALQLGLGYRTGPLSLIDSIGLDTHLRVTGSLHDMTADARYAPPPLLTRMVAAGRIGGSTSTGFRDTSMTKGNH
ncbi:hypothetical protein CH298_26600 [Rhodococcoides fascians]|uniref:3-hydroxyacyl-CoA dehydrogenase family protein n=1 Tax=Rhodococcoides fascians TaxID=1828 RepID=UPI000B9C3D60|nr:3-hydroxyacyl-CoA dehydrogenase NAD-binding domain-containing protein [Rhodococcus fascians]OZE81345.1 hypothetical protein CH303_27140 [Rhodococcus fascians]OZF10169.1 hypothetical protein CH298_26600 [Rhodococcus fascians]OZF13260.1 hypothetical protein CH297_26895 [Rhodococcus fascians]OZF59357.1 hypothetical protein CH308_27340 [Rhodococcus fascians]OZF60473.1 hypothetical protein CH307_27530 [Rhodococcus fascians]